ncbi:MAG TPA: bifunctional chorismate mutase/prephenate dehydrogenase [Phycisphaerae bacterium]|nr:bifunctional chorismate mutase/prephenate dehydrogenase [Phycisphaerae bacterium]
MNPQNQNPESSRVRPLPALRAMIDSIDRDLLRLLARRYALVGEIAEYKRDHRLPIRDFQREREILDDRRDRGAPLGLSPQLVESLFRLILWASRDLQAALKAEVPPDIEPRTVAVIGGKGAMGRCMAEMFADLGHAVMVADLDTPLTPEEAAATADVVLISVPIDVTVEVVRKLGPMVRSEALLMDVTSIKGAPVAAMLEATQASVVGTHPLFGPSVHSLQGQRVVLCPGRGEAWLDWVRRMFHARGLAMMEATPEEHDQAMAIVQVLVHFSTEVMGKTLARLGVSIETTLAFTSPIYLMELLMTARHFAQSPGLYASIQMSNPGTAEVTEAFLRTAEQLRQEAVNKDHEAFLRMFSEVHDYFGAFTEQALEQSSFLIDRLVERA